MVKITEDVCWLISYINMTWPQGAQIFGKTLFLDVSVRVCPDEISTELVGSGEWWLTLTLVGVFYPMEDLNKRKMEEGRIRILWLWLFELGYWSSPVFWLELSGLVRLVLKPSDLYWNWDNSFLVEWRHSAGFCPFSATIITWANWLLFCSFGEPVVCSLIP
jgi:hypothetical protein